MNMRAWVWRGWRITAGVRFNDDSLTAVSQTDNGTYVFAGKRFAVPPGAYATAKAAYPLAMPYFGVGFGHKPVGKGFGFVADIGVAYGGAENELHPVADPRPVRGLEQRLAGEHRCAGAERQGVALSLVSGGADRRVVPLLKHGDRGARALLLWQITKSQILRCPPNRHALD
ncbi:hypothetical protein AWB83_06835 [Caballeronia ptereochthonis]|uniref:Uncharacterized protein n=1 Tax=Caballeronia ptereochthonis TaxID=1777144 RepID=A0A158E9N3_9BURK|nr:hypothetical protein AWB83_06835 [Caballeronia ptereochthonis]